MAKPIITIGCKTSHGGTVVSGSMVSDVHGKGIARIGDKVPCPQCKGVHVIVSGDMTVIVDGAAVARDGDKTSCGAVLIADQMTSLVDQGLASSFLSSDAGPLAQSSASSLIAKEQSAAPNTDADEDDLEQYFEFTDSDGKPFAMRYRLDTADGKLHEANLDGNGRTAKFPMSTSMQLIAWKNAR
jgi:uncharacterized Zn-binding protein involved in type VI secretion